MSILIKDIDLPKDDKPLNLEIYSDGHIWINWGPEYERKDNVAIQIDRPHGRLGDLDVLLEESLKEGAYNYVDSWQIAEQPTIIEAEGEE